MRVCLIVAMLVGCADKDASEPAAQSAQGMSVPAEKDPGAEPTAGQAKLPPSPKDPGAEPTAGQAKLPPSPKDPGAAKRPTEKDPGAAKRPTEKDPGAGETNEASGPLVADALIGGPGTASGKKPRIGTLGADRESNDERPRSRIKLSTARALDETTLAATLVTRKIRAAYLAGIKRCHERELAVDKTVTGVLILRFTVSTTGRVSRSTVSGFNSGVDACVRGLSKKWRFGVPKKDDAPAAARFSIELGLTSGA